MKSILLVEDDGGLREAAYQALEAAGYHVVEALDGFRAQDLLELIRPSLLLVDLDAPGGAIAGKFRDSGGKRLVAADRDEAVQLRLERFGAGEHRAGELDGRDLLCRDEAAQHGCGQQAGITVHRHFAPNPAAGGR